jgi:hypothetical protein
MATIAAARWSGLRRRGERLASSGRDGKSSNAVFEAPAFVTGLDDIAMMREAIEQRGGHFGVSGEDGWPFGKIEVGSDDD